MEETDEDEESAVEERSEAQMRSAPTLTDEEESAQGDNSRRCSAAFSSSSVDAERDREVAYADSAEELLASDSPGLVVRAVPLGCPPSVLFYPASFPWARQHPAVHPPQVSFLRPCPGFLSKPLPPSGYCPLPITFHDVFSSFLRSCHVCPCEHPLVSAPGHFNLALNPPSPVPIPPAAPTWHGMQPHADSFSAC